MYVKFRVKTPSNCLETMKEFLRITLLAHSAYFDDAQKRFKVLA